MAKSLAVDPTSPTLPLQRAERKYSSSTYRSMCEIPLDIARSEFDRRSKVFGHNHFGMPPTINLHGAEFRAVVRPLLQPTALEPDLG